jgi:hypothetical protein
VTHSMLTFINEQLDADERIAQRIIDDGKKRGNMRSWLKLDVRTVDGDTTTIQSLKVYQPEAALDDIAAKRAIIEHHAPETPVYEAQPDPFGRLVCRTCGTQDGWHDVSWPCDTARHLVSTFRSREGYDPDWAPR